MKPKIIIKKLDCGHWSMNLCMEITYNTYISRELEHLDSFSDILLILNGEAYSV